MNVKYLAAARKRRLLMPMLVIVFHGARTLKDPEKVIPKYRPYIQAKARRLNRKNGDRFVTEDLEAAGMVGAASACEEFSMAMGVPFEAYVKKRIMWAIGNEIRMLWSQEVGEGSPRSYDAMEETHEFFGLPESFQVEAEADTMVDRRSMSSLLNELIDELSSRERYVFTEHVLGGRGLTDLGKEMGVSKNMVYKIRNRARDKMRDRLAANGVHGVDDLIGG